MVMAQGMSAGKAVFDDDLVTAHGHWLMSTRLTPGIISPRKRRPVFSNTRNSCVRTVPVPTTALIGIGLGAGVIAGLLGVGGGIVLVPAFTVLLGLEVKQTIATSL